MYMLALVFLLSFLGGLVPELFIKSIPRCSAAAYCNGACSQSALCAPDEPRPSNVYDSSLGLQFVRFELPSDASAALTRRFEWCRTSGLSPPPCAATCTNASAPDCATLACVYPPSIPGCERVTEQPCNEAIEQCTASSGTLQHAMATDRRSTETLGGRILVLVLVSLAVFLVSWLVRHILLFVTKEGRCCCSALVIRLVGTLVILAVLLAVVLLSVGLTRALSVSDWLSSLRRFVSTFAISLAADLVKLTVFYYIFPNTRSRWMHAYSELHADACERALPAIESSTKLQPL